MHDSEREMGWDILTRTRLFVPRRLFPAAEWPVGAFWRCSEGGERGKMSQRSVGRSATPFSGMTGSLDKSKTWARQERRVPGWQRACDQSVGEDEEKPNARFGPQACCDSFGSGESSVVRDDDRQLRVVAGARPGPPLGGLGPSALSLLLTLGPRVFRPSRTHDW